MPDGIVFKIIKKRELLAIYNIFNTINCLLLKEKQQTWWYIIISRKLGDRNTCMKKITRVRKIMLATAHLLLLVG